LDESWDRVHCARPGAPRVTNTGGFWTNQVTEIPEEWWERWTGHFVTSHLMSQRGTILFTTVASYCGLE